MVATCQVEELSATAVPNCARGTRFGSSAWPVGMAKARATPNSTITANTGRAESRPRAGEHEQQQRAEALEREAGSEDAAAVAAVGEVPGRQDQQHERQELRQADEPEVERIARDLVHLPADRHGLHLHGERGDEARRDEAREVAVAQHRATRVGGRVHAGARPVNEAICDVRIARRGRAARLRSDRRSAAR